MCVSWIWEGARGGGAEGGGGGGERSPEEEEPEEGEPLIHFHSAYLPLADLARARDFGPVSLTASRSPAAEAWAVAPSGHLGTFVLACGDLGFAPVPCSFPPSSASLGLQMEADDADSPPRRAPASRLRRAVGRCCRR